MQRNVRMKRELSLLAESPPHGVSCWAVEGQMDRLEAKLIGGEDTPYSNGVFKLEIHIPERYPFEPPKVRFVTPIYHPNIDGNGRICLDTLKSQPKGMWKPSLNISSVLTTILLLMAQPNPDDPLMADISNEFKYNKPQFLENAKKWTLKYAQDTPLKDFSNSLTSTDESHQETSERSDDSDSDLSSDDENKDSSCQTSSYSEKRGVKRLSGETSDRASKVSRI